MTAVEWAASSRTEETLSKRYLSILLVLAVLAIPAAVYASKRGGPVAGPYLTVTVSTVGSDWSAGPDGHYSVSGAGTAAINKLHEQGYEPVLMSVHSTGSGAGLSPLKLVIIAKKK